MDYKHLGKKYTFFNMDSLRIIEKWINHWKPKNEIISISICIERITWWFMNTGEGKT